jgi:hypothetical protein
VRFYAEALDNEEIDVLYGADKSSQAHLEDEKAKNSLSIYPNPFTQDANISFYLEQPENIQVSVFNLNGILVDRVFEGHLPEGMHKMFWENGYNAVNLPAGMYILRMSTRMWSENLIIVKSVD